MVKILATVLAVLLSSQSVFAADGTFSFSNPTYFPNTCKTQGQISIIYAEGPSKWTAELITNVADNGSGTTVKDLNFFPVTTYLSDVTSNVPLKTAAAAGALIGLRYNTQVNLTAESDSDTIARLQSDCETIYSYTSRYVKYIFLPQDQITLAKYNVIVGQGYTPVGYNIDSLDYTQSNYSSEASCIATVVNAYNAQIRLLGAGQAYYIALQRDLYECTAVSAPSVLANLKAYNYTVVDLATCLNDSSPYRTSCSSTGSTTTASSSKTTGAASAASTTSSSAAASTTTAAAASSGANSISSMAWGTLFALTVGLVATIMQGVRSGM